MMSFLVLNAGKYHIILTISQSFVLITKCLTAAKKKHYVLRKNIFACLFSVHNTISLLVMNKYV